MSQISIHRDLTKHFLDRLHKHIVEGINLGEIAEIPPRDTVEMIMACLLAELTCGAWSFDVKEEEFMRICQGAYRKTKKTFDGFEKKRKSEWYN
jgi:hypothetical protein